MSKKKKLKIEIPDSALKDIPEEDREDVVSQIKEMFDNGDPAEIGRPIPPLPPGAKYCPECGTLLEPGPTFPVPNKSGDGQTVVQIFDCLKCDTAYMGEPLN